MAARPLGAGVATLVGGFFILIGGVLVALFGWFVSALSGLSSGLFEVGLVLGLLTMLTGALMITIPQGHAVWGILAIVFALVAIPFALAGLVIGSLLTFVGGALSIGWRPPRPSSTITVEARVIPPSSGG